MRAVLDCVLGVAVLLLATVSYVATSQLSAAEPVSLSGPTMGTTYHVKFVRAAATESLANLQKDIDAALDEINRQMSTYRDDSEVSRFNHARAGAWFPVSPATAAVAAAALDVSRKTDGALDVTVGHLVRLWHFGPPVDPAGNSAAQLKPPTDEAIRKAQSLVGYKRMEVRLDPPALKKHVDGLEIDLSSVAGGYVVDRVAELLLEKGIGDFMVEVGCEIRTGGRRADGKPWRIAIERPLRNRRELLTAIPLTDAALSTSGDYRNYFEFDGHRYSHIIDPATGWPIEHKLASVSVMADTCMEADAWDTALLVLGPDRGFDCAEKNGIAALFLSPAAGTDQDDVRATSAWKTRVDVGD